MPENSSSTLVGFISAQVAKFSEIPSTSFPASPPRYGSLSPDSNEFLHTPSSPSSSSPSKKFTSSKTQPKILSFSLLLSSSLYSTPFSFTVWPPKSPPHYLLGRTLSPSGTSHLNPIWVFQSAIIFTVSPQPNLLFDFLSHFLWPKEEIF